MCSAMRSVTSLFLGLVTLAAATIACTATSSIPYHPRERRALLNFKKGLINEGSRLTSWVDGGNCCDWDGVVCHNQTGHVLELHLRNSYSDFRNLSDYHIYKSTKLSGNISDSLLDLKHLVYLDLSNNDFEGTQIPIFLGSMMSLRYLNLSGAGFYGFVPFQLGNLFNLVYLNLGYQYNLRVHNLQWLSRLTLLQFLDMSYVDLSNASDWLQVTNSLPSLIDLRLSQCKLYYVPQVSFINFSSLVTLDLSFNQFNNSFVIPNWFSSLKSLVSLNLGLCNFHGVIPDSLQNITSLRNLDLSYNSFESPFPSWFYKFSHLETLILQGNNLEGSIPEAIANITSLIQLDLSHNNLEGAMPSSFANLCNLQKLDLSRIILSQDIAEVLEIFSACVSERLEILSLQRCKLFGQLTDEIGRFRNLEYIDLSLNSISGPIPQSLGVLKSLKELTIYDNQLNGTLPECIGQLAKLEFLNVDRNSLKGNVSEVVFANLTKLMVIYASENQLTLAVSPDWVPPFQLLYISLSSWNLGPQFPLWLQTQKCLYFLDISNTGIRDTIPSWFWNLSAQFIYLNLSYNDFYGKAADQIMSAPIYGSDLAIKDLSSNYFEGQLPCISSNVTVLDLSNNQFSGSISPFLCCKMGEQKKLEFLHLGDNELSGEIPDCWTNWQSLTSIDLENNNLTGNLPNSIGSVSHLRSLHLRNNSLSGALPLSLQNCSQLLALDLGENELVGNIPGWIGERLSNAMIISLGSNNFQGYIPDEICALQQLRILDLAHNNLSGKIPKCFINISSMAERGNSTDQIMYRSNSTLGAGFLENAILVMKGIVLEYSTNLYLVTIIDLSDNNLSEEIPAQITSLFGLQSLNLSGNHLTGNIPPDIGNMGSLESLDLSSNQLGGRIPLSMAKMTFLSALNLSYNNLTGQIPTGTQIQSFSASSFLGNSLCGEPVSENCSTNDAAPDGGEEDHKDNGHDLEWFYVTFPLGFIIGFWVIVGPLLYSESWRFTYYKLVESLLWKLWDAITCGGHIFRRFC